MTASRLVAGLARGALVASLLFVASSAHADANAADKETARRLMAEGRKRREAKDLKGALESFQAADAIMQVPTTGLEVARTEESLGLLVEARDKFVTMMRFPQTPHEPKPFGEARTIAQQMNEELTARIPTIRVVLSGVPQGMAPNVTVDGATIPPAALVAPRTVNPGHHVIVASVEGGAENRAEVDVAEKEAKEVPLDVPPPPVVVAPPPHKDAPEMPDKAAPARSHGGAPVLAYVGFGVGAAGLIVGGVTGFIALSHTQTAKKSCVGNACPPATYGDLDTASSMAKVSNIGFVVGGVGVVFGVVSLIVGGRSAPTEATTTARVTPWVGLGSAGVNGTF